VEPIPVEEPECPPVEEPECPESEPLWKENLNYMKDGIELFYTHFPDFLYQTTGWDFRNIGVIKG